jgi:chromosomal replication initiation ATPase DnaA
MISPYVFVGLEDYVINPTDNQKEVLIKECIAKHFNIKVEDLYNRSRKIEVLIPRQLAMYFIRQKTKICLKEIAYSFVGFDHTTATNSVKQVQNAIDTKDDKVFPHYLAIKSKLNSVLLVSYEQSKASFNCN